MPTTRSARLIIPALSLLAAAGIASFAIALEPPAKDAAATTPTTPTKAAPTLLDPIKALAGEWDMTDDAGKTQLGSVFRVVAAGSAVCETMMPGTPYEMVNMYHLDGPDTLVITHYCAVGNQPRMTGHAPKTPGTYEFTIKDAAKDVSNLASPDGMYMGQLTLIIKDQDHIVQDWVHTDKGKPGGKVSFELTRRHADHH
ncbi:MAG: hypothetical protein IT436_14915 [Phycisphaerales bacterium]|nr:hypothetical protein [Phycisphaerales bacterium]